MESAGIELRDTGSGKWGLFFIEDDPVSELTLTSDHIIEIAPLQIGPDGVKRPNIVSLTYFSPERRYENAEIGLHEQDEMGDYLAADWSRIDNEIEKYGDQEYAIQLTFQMDFARAQQIARRLFHMNRAGSATLKTNWAGLAAWGKKVITIEVPGVGAGGASVFLKCRKGAMRVDDTSGTCEIPVQIIPAELQTPWDPATMEAAAPPVLEPSQYAADLDTPAIPSGYALVQYSGGTYEVRISTAGVDDATTAQATWRAYNGDLPGSWVDMTEVDFTFSYASAVVGNIGEAADFRIQFFGSDGEASNPSPVLGTSDLQIDNSPPVAPAQSTSGAGGSRTITYSTSELHAVKLTFERQKNGGVWSLISTRSDIRPYTEFTNTVTQNNSFANETWAWRIAAYTSNGTIGSYATGSVFFAADTP